MGLRNTVASYISTTSSNTEEQETKKDSDIGFDGKWERPRANELPEGGLGIAGDVHEEQVRDIKENAVFDRLKNSPEILALMEAVVDDIIGGEEPTFEYVGRTDNAANPGKRNIRDAKRFWRDNKELIGDSIMDAMAVGDGYLYKKTMDEEQAKIKALEYVTKNYDFNNEDHMYTAASTVINKADGLGLNQTQELDLVPASTVEHDIDEFGNIERYVQDIGAEEYDLDPEKVIHHSYLNLNGKTYGFTPLAAMFAELDMLANAKDYNGVKFDNAAVPNKVFKLPEDGPSSQNFEMVKETVKKYRQLQNKHRDLVLTGDVEIEDLNDTSDVEFKELIQLVTRILAMAWGVPPSRIGGVIGSDGATTSAMAQEGYNKRVKRMQDKYETILNKELFEPLFSVRISFQDPDVKSEIRRAERDLKKTQVVQQQMALGLMNRDDALEYLGKRADQIPDNVEEQDMVDAAREMAQSSDTGADSSPKRPADEEVDQQMTPDRNGSNDESVVNQ